MEITIKIDCESISEFYAHLGMLRKQIKKTANKHKLGLISDEFEPHHAKELYDDNCYGSHKVKIK